jgi:hypothetical protein
MSFVYRITDLYYRYSCLPAQQRSAVILIIITGFSLLFLGVDYYRSTQYQPTNLCIDKKQYIEKQILSYRHCLSDGQCHLTNQLTPPFDCIPYNPELLTNITAINNHIADYVTYCGPTLIRCTQPVTRCLKGACRTSQYP